MNQKLILPLLVLFVVSTGQVSGQTPAPSPPQVLIKTTMGDITIDLNPDKSPLTVENFLSYVRDGFYEGTIFHRVLPGSIIQGGAHTADMKEKPAKAPIKNEAANRLKNKRGTVAMARRGAHSATSQFFINLVNNSSLNHTAKTEEGFGYCVFGKVVAGMDVADSIAKVPTGWVKGYPDVPLEPVTILSVEIVSVK